MSNRWTVGLCTLVVLQGLALEAAGQERAPPPRPARAAAAEAPDPFAFELYARLRGREGNLVFSPYNLSAGLASAHAGARGETARQMAAVLHLPADRPAGMGKLSGLRFLTANALWGQEGYDFLPEYCQALKEHHGADLFAVDFRTPAQACQAVNGWAEKRTQGKVKDLLRPELVDSRSRLVLTNAVYLKADWKAPFRKGRTADGLFRAVPGRPVTVPFMAQAGTFPYYADDALQAFELPYAGGDLAFTVLLPQTEGGLAGMEKGLSAGRVADIIGQLRPRKLDVALPRFRVSTALNLQGPLSVLGMSAAFDPQKADFSGMIGGRERLYLSAVAHAASVGVDEDGTEAAAATAAVAKGRSIVDPDPTAVLADHAFVFLVRDLRSGRVLFLGRLANPKG